MPTRITSSARCTDSRAKAHVRSTPALRYSSGKLPPSRRPLHREPLAKGQLPRRHVNMAGSKPTTRRTAGVTIDIQLKEMWQSPGVAGAIADAEPRFSTAREFEIDPALENVDELNVARVVVPPGRAIHGRFC
jgi:hypothetical protein